MFEPVEVKNLKAGMTIGRDVIAGGSVLVSEGAVLTEALIDVFRRRGVDEVIIRTGEAPPEYGGSGATTEVLRRLEASGTTISKGMTDILNKALAYIDAQFEGMDGDPVMAPLKLAVAEYWGKLASKKVMEQKEQK